MFPIPIIILYYWITDDKFWQEKKREDDSIFGSDTSSRCSLLIGLLVFFFGRFDIYCSDFASALPMRISTTVYFQLDLVLVVDLNNVSHFDFSTEPQVLMLTKGWQVNVVPYIRMADYFIFEFASNIWGDGCRAV